MAQQLTATRSPAAYRGVESYAREHPGEGAAAAYLALGHAYMLDRKYDDAVNAYRQAAKSGKALDDYADYLGAQAALKGNRGADAYALLDRFAERHPGSIFNSDAPVLLANAYLQQTDPQSALKMLLPLADTQQASHVGFRYALGRAYQMSGDTTRAAAIYPRHLPQAAFELRGGAGAHAVAGDECSVDGGGAQDPCRPALQREAIYGGRLTSTTPLRRTAPASVPAISMR